MKLLKFWSPTCRPCVTQSEVLEGFDGCPIESINVKEQVEETIEFNVRSVPTLILVDERRKVLWKKVGVTDRELLEETIEKLKK